MRPNLLIRSLLWTWFFAALLVGRFALLQRVPPAAVQGTLLALTALLVVAYKGWPAFRAWADSLDLRAIVALHVSRFVGFYFIYLYRQGALPYAFAVPGGIGDIIVAALALVVVFGGFSDETRRRLITIWNVVGFVDILMVVVSAARLGLADPSSMRALTILPLSLLPTFLVPLIIATHLLIFARIRREVARVS
ncbi:MAG: hypothetical protein JWM35_140 [Verrucomicrobia bacterium]|nr:hypothetical protein [Verrucomicrobiota bacterium]